MVIGSYFLYNELKQVAGAGISYFSEFWNYLDFLPPVLFWVDFGLEMYIEDKNETYYEWNSINLSVTNFLLMFKLLYFLRSF